MYDYKNKESNIESMNDYMLIKTLSMFDYSGLPDSLNPIELEKMLQKYGYAFITEYENKPYAFIGGWGGKLDVYGNPTEIIITNPNINFNKTLSIVDDGVLIINDDLQLGLIPLFDKFHTLMVENEITMYVSSYNARIPMLISAGDDTTKESAESFLEKVERGELGVIGENRLFEGIKSQTTMSNGNVNMTQLVELNQYMKATLYNEVGLKANFNMKRERLNSSEVEMNEDNIFPLIDNMFHNRIDGIERINKKYGLTADVKFHSSWNRGSDDDVHEVEEIEENEVIEDDDKSESVEQLDEETETDIN